MGNIHTILLGILIGVILTLIIKGVLFKFWCNFCDKASLIKKYWLFVIPFAIFSIIAYFFTLKYSNQMYIQTNLTILGQALTLIFAIFVGYFAFLQVVENRFEKLREKGYLYFKRPAYIRAIQLYEEAHSISPKNVSVLSNLIELYLITQSQDKLEKKLKLLGEIVIEDAEKLNFYYLKTARFLFKEELRIAKTELAVLIDFAKRTPLSYVPWQFDDLQKTEIYKHLTGDAKKILVNLISYISKKLTLEQKNAFEDGNYTF